MNNLVFKSILFLKKPLLTSFRFYISILFLLRMLIIGVINRNIPFLFGFDKHEIKT